MSEKKRRTCQICGRPYVPTSNVQKYCPDCRKEMQRNGCNIGDAYRAYKKAGAPGPVTVSHIETPEDMLKQTIEVRCEGEDSGGPALEEYIIMPTGYEGHGGSGKTSEELDTAQIATVLNKRPCVVQVPTDELPDGLAVIEEHAEILRRYYKGELVDKEELLARIRERLGEF